MSKHGTLAQRLGFGSSGATTTPTTHAKPTTPAPRAPNPSQPRPRDTSTGIDARRLSPAQYEQRLGQLGLSAPSADHRRLQPPGDPALHRSAARDLERADRRAARDRVRIDEARTAELTASAIDGRTATPDEVRARIALIGADSVALAVRPVGRALDPTKDQNDGAAGHVQRHADREVASAVHRAMQLGQKVDAKKLSPGEVRALLEIRGAGI